MNNDMNVNTLIRSMKETSIPKVDVASKVMQRIYSFHGKHRNHRQQWFRISPVWITACVLLLIATASVSAATLFNTNWNGIQVDIDDNEMVTSTPADENEPSSNKDLETVISESADVKTISFDEAANQFPFSLLRPQDSKFTLVKSFGVVPNDGDYSGELSLVGFYDIFQWNQQDIVVNQNLDGPLTKSLDPNQTKWASLTFQGASWENVELTDDTLAMFTENGSTNLLIVKYKTTDSKVISLIISGDLSKEDLIELAKTYVGK